MSPNYSQHTLSPTLEIQSMHVSHVMTMIQTMITWPIIESLDIYVIKTLQRGRQKSYVHEEKSINAKGNDTLRCLILNQRISFRNEQKRYLTVKMTIRTFINKYYTKMRHSSLTGQPTFTIIS